MKLFFFPAITLVKITATHYISVDSNTYFNARLDWR